MFEYPATGESLSGAEGLAAAGVELLFSHIAGLEHARGWIPDADRLKSATPKKLAGAFRLSRKNPLSGIDGRFSPLQGLASVPENHDTDQQPYGRPGNLIDECLAASKRSFRGKTSVDATQVPAIVLKCFGAMWPSGYYIHHGHERLNPGDCGYHSQLATGDETDGIVPFHKLSQWLIFLDRAVTMGWH